MVRSKRKEDFSKFMNSVLKNSMLTGIPQIAGAKNNRQRLLRAVVFILCVAGFIYQSATFMELYYEYKTVIDIMVTNPKEVEFPGVTFCSPNPIRTNKFCANDSIYIADCRRLLDIPETDWCKCYPWYCDHRGVLDLSLPIAKAVEPTNDWDEEQLKNYTQSYWDISLLCESVGAPYKCDESNIQHFRAVGADPEYLTNCYSFATMRGKPDGKVHRIPPRTEFRVLLDTDAKHYLAQILFVNFQIHFHDPKAFANPYVNGHIANAGFETTFWFKKLVKKLLPPPYETNCKDYVTEWKARGGHGPVDERSCIDECRKNASLQIRGCQEYKMTHPIDWDFKRCDHFDNENVTALAEVCEKDCRPACYEETYVLRKEERSRTGYTCKSRSRIDFVSWITLNFDGMETTIYSYSPKYQIIETFSYLGGYVGMWLGISLVAVFDFFETLVEVCKYPFRRWIAMKEKKSKIHRMKSAQWTL